MIPGIGALDQMLTPVLGKLLTKVSGGKMRRRHAGKGGALITGSGANMGTKVKRAGNAHAQKVGKLMRARGMGLAEASRMVKKG